MANLKQQITPPRLTARLTVRLTPSELSRVRARAKKLRLTPSELVRRRLSGGKLIVKYYQTVDPAVIAQHFEFAEQHKRSADYYKRAGEAAVARS